MSTPIYAFSWLKKYAPEFRICSEKIKVLLEPQDFFATLKKRIETSTNRVTIASLYLGTGELEQQLVNVLQHTLNASNSQVQIRFLLDCNRGSRGLKNSRTMLLPLLRENWENVKVSLYHTPDLRGFLKSVIPERWNETIGLAHMKIYIIDDAVIMSGANLSNDYFTNRQDRYVLLEDKDLADFFHSLVITVSSFSLQLKPDNTLELHKDWTIHPYTGDYNLFKSEASKKVLSLLSAWKSRNENSDPESTHNLQKDSLVYPLIQMGPLGITNDSKVTELLFQACPALSRIHLASGYFNLTSDYVNLILNSTKANFNILTASPKANGFYGAKGVSGSVPKVYTYVAKEFYNKLNQTHQDSRVCLSEYERPNWTFHAKGLWCYFPNQSLPSISLIGSPNFGHRSVHKDLEAQVLILTDNSQLRQQLHDEQQRLYSLSNAVANKTFSLPERYVPFWVRVFARLFKNYF